MKRCIACILLLALFAMGGCSQQAQAVSNEFFAMDTVCTQIAYGDVADVIVSNQSIVTHLEKYLSKTMDGSDIWKINQKPSAVVTVDEQTVELIEDCLQAYEDTGGAFHPGLGTVMDVWGFGTEQEYVPDEQTLKQALQHASLSDAYIAGDTVQIPHAEIDLGGAAKGYALDILRQNMEAEQVEAALISLGGSIYARGSKPDGKWTVGIRNPEGEAADYVCTLELVDECISTSGAYERGFEQDGVYYHHILDPETGYPVQNELLSVSVVDKSGLQTDILSTALFVMGLEKGLQYAHDHEYAAVFITQDKKIISTENFGRELQVEEADYERK